MPFRFSLFSKILLPAALLVIVAVPMKGQSCLRGFEGEWTTGYGKMPIRVSGDQASGSYGSGRTLTGTVRGAVFSGRWRYPNGRWGQFRFVHDGNGKFVGKWGEKDGRLTGNWTGSCLATLPETPPVSPPGTSSSAGPSSSPRPGSTGGGTVGSGLTPSVGSGGSAAGCATTFAGRWKTNFGELTISVRGNEATGSYGSGRTVSGLIRGNVLEGTWRYSNGRWGRLRFTHSGNGTFTGNYGEKDVPMRSSWKGTCLGGLPGAVSSAGGFAGMCAPVSGTGGRGICQDPRVEQLMNDWLSRAIPPRKPGATLRYDCWGRVLGSANPGLITANQRPDTDGRTRCDYLSDHSHLYTSTNLGTMREYIDQNR